MNIYSWVFVFVLQSIYFLWWSVCPNILPIQKIRLFSCYWILRMIYIFWIGVLHQIFFFQSSAFPFILLTESFKEQFLILMNSNLSVLDFINHDLHTLLRNLCLTQVHEEFSPMFSVGNFIQILGFIFSPWSILK